MAKICKNCGKEYTGKNKYFCSNPCKGAYRQNKRSCVVCGTKFDCPPSSLKKCCSPGCSSKHRQSMHAKGVYSEFVELSKKAKKTHPLLAKGERHINAKRWIIQSPEGKTYECRNLLHWCRENEHLFDGTYRQAWDGLSKVKYTAQGKRKRGSLQWKGWTLLKWED